VLFTECFLSWKRKASPSKLDFRTAVAVLGP
jgi:hypothetical protein